MATAHAKLNLFLRVHGKRPDGFHELEMVNISLGLADDISVRPAERLSLEVAGDLPADERNIAWRAALAWASWNRKDPHYSITIKKRIPVGAGLAGGSTDAATVLKLLGGENLPEIGLSLGADVPYCLFEKPAIVRGIGEKISPITVKKDILHFVLVNPGFEVLTKTVFQNFQASLGRDSRALVEALRNGDLSGVCSGISNDLEPVTSGLHPEIARMKTALLEEGATGAFMTGSGPTVFGLFPDETIARKSADALRQKFAFSEYTRPVL